MRTLTVTSVQIDTPGAGQVTIVGTYADQSFTTPVQQITVGELPAGNANWSRGHRVTDMAHFIIRNGADNVAILISALSQIAVALRSSLTWPPLFTLQPANVSVAADGSAHADFLVTVSSELNVTYQWFESADGVTYGSALSDAGIYSNTATASLRITPVLPTLTSDNTNVSDGDTVTVGAKTYTFKTALTPTEGEVLIGANADASLLNLINAINLTGTPGTDYSCAAANPSFSAHTTVTAHKLTLIPILGGTLATTTTASHLSWNAASYASKQGYYYNCIATNSAGSTTSTAAVLTIT